MRSPVECIDPECDEEIVAMSPDADFYYDYDSIPRLPAPRFLMLKEGIIIADGWLIQIACTEECLEFITRVCGDWRDGTKDGCRQLNGFIDAVQTILIGKSIADSEEDDGLYV